MAQIKLNTATSVVDYLASQKQPTDFSSRAKLFKEKGFEERLGKYTGSANQNVAFLRQLQGEKTLPTIQSPAQQPIIGPHTTPSGAVVDATTGELLQGPPETPTTIAPVEPTKPITASEALANLGFQPKTLTADQALTQATTAPLFDVFQQKQKLSTQLSTAGAETEKQQLESKAAQETKNFINTMGRRGLFFSGETETGIKSLADSLAASKLGVDRELAGKLLGSDLDFQERIIRDVQTIVEKAGSDNEKEAKRALDILEAQGLTIGADGKTLVPTLAAEKSQEAAEMAQAKFEFQQQQQELTNQINQAKLELQSARDIQSANNAAERLSMAQERLNLSQERFQLQQVKTKTAGPFTETQINKGAANAGMAIDEFRKLDVDTKNYFINNKTLIDKAKKDIDEELENNTNSQNLIDNINKQEIPQTVKEILNSYIEQKAPKETKGRSLWHPSTWF